MDDNENRIMKAVKLIYASISALNLKNITDIVKETNLHHNTVRGYLELIEYIQNQPKLRLSRTGSSYQISKSSELTSLISRCPYCGSTNEQVMTAFDEEKSKYYCNHCKVRYEMIPKLLSKDKTTDKGDSVSD